ncbi:hypothetical protein F3Y22_tig00110894pilonHSYRG00006 [Hibiscus syriacus]|uniref:Integrase catalytic domain-containing protein n=1 Tax=Hibiscus syriacus TaxID=106335 RepID=A0A6A2ZEU3_HIBSY|nr:hypothetical protein F3Y22_tig00110894pilonHSYRG00006 [Hibiscus syriacus]
MHKTGTVEKAELEGRIHTLEEGMTENRSYLQRILQLVHQAAEEKDSPQSVRSQPPAAAQQNKGEGKQPYLVTVLSEHEKYTFQPNEQGIFASKPVGFIDDLPFNQKLQEENIMGSSSEIKVDSKGLFGSSGLIVPRPKLELQIFDGSNSRGWVRKCQKYFNLLGVPEEQKVDVAAMYLMGKGETWFDGYIMQKHRVTWHEFEADLCHRFCDRNYSDIIEEFNKLMQKGSVEEYQERFEELRPYLLQQNMHLGEDYFISSFINGLKEELKHKVKVLEPKKLSEAYRQAKLYELANEIEGKKYKSSNKFFYTSSSSPQGSGNKGFLPKTIPPNINTKQSLVDYRRAHNLCFKCGGKFAPGHQCKDRQLNCMEETEESAEQELIDGEPEEVEETTNEALEISINAITGNVGHTTLRIQGSIRGKPINVLIDSGSTHSFVTPKWAKEGVEVVNTQPLVITVANGEKLFSTARSNMMEEFSPILMDFKAKTISFEKDGKTVVIRVQDSFIPLPLQELLAEFKEVFEEPKGMPPRRKHDHAIVLKQRTQPVNLRPYRFPYHHKTEVEKIKDEDIPKTAFRTTKGIMNSRILLEILLKNKLYAKKSKCFFGQQQVEYLGHLISAKRVATDPSKIKAMQQWPLPKNLKALRGFLGLTGYYRKFIKGYGELSKPLTNMLKKEGFHWSTEAKEAFERLKVVMCEAPVLALPNFEQKYFLETDASSRGIGVVLSQAGRPITYLSRALGPKHADLSIYEKEYLAILMAVSHWRHYLESGSFVIKIDHEPLKHLLEQKLTTVIQKKGLTKLLGLNYTIQYRKGRSNKVADALSRQQLDSGEFLQIGVTIITPTWVNDIENNYEADVIAQEKILVLQPDSVQDWKFTKGVLYYKTGYILEAHETLDRRMKIMTQEHIKQCDICQRTKVEHIPKPGLLQPISVPNNAWEVITMDFIEELPPSTKYKCILVVIDKFTKYAHFLPLSHPYTVVEVAKVYLDQVYKLHGPPKVAISDRDKSFTSLFWQELLKQLGTTTYFSTAYHPETDGQSERLNQCLEQYLRREFQEGDEVYLKLQPYRQTSLALMKNLKLAARFFGPYKIQKRIGQVTYKLELPPESKSHPVFHWMNMTPANATWEDAKVLKTQFPDFDHWGQGSTDGGGIVTMEGGLGFEGMELGKVRREELRKQQSHLGEERVQLGIERGLGIDRLFE